MRAPEGFNLPNKKSPETQESNRTKLRNDLQVRLASKKYGIGESSAIIEWTNEYPGRPSQAELFAQYEKLHPDLNYHNLSDEELTEILTGMAELGGEEYLH